MPSKQGENIHIPLDIADSHVFCQVIHLVISADSLVNVDADAHQVKMKVGNGAEPLEISHVAGSGRQASQDGSSKSASFAQPMILCREGKTLLILTDLAASKILMIFPLRAPKCFCAV